MAKNYKIGKEFTANDKDTIEENSLYQPIPRNWKIRINFVRYRTQQIKFCQLPAYSRYNVRYGVPQK